MLVAADGPVVVLKFESSYGGTDVHETQLLADVISNLNELPNTRTE